MPTIFCIGRNYAAHVKEMGSTLRKDEEPVVFLKPEHALIRPPDAIRLPGEAGEIHHEAEVVVRVGPGREAEAIALGLDLTDRTRQAEAKREGRPWAAAKGFRGSAPVGPFVPAERVGPLHALRFSLTVNGALRQQGDTSRMLRTVPQLLQSIDAWFGLAEGDLVFTGTPKGVSAIQPGDVLVLELEGVPEASARFVVA